MFKKLLLGILLLSIPQAQAGDVFIWGTQGASSCANNLADGICFSDGTFQSTAAAGSATSYPPTGAAGGDLSGTYPNPKVLRLTSYPNGFTRTGASGEIIATSYPLGPPFIITPTPAPTATPQVRKLTGDVVSDTQSGNLSTKVISLTSYPNGFTRTGASGEIIATSYPLNLNGPFFTSYPTTLAPGTSGAYDLFGRNSTNTGNEYKSMVHASSDRVWLGDVQYNSSFSVDNPDLTGTLAAAVFKHKDGTGNHANIFEIKDTTGITNYISVDYLGQITAQNITMANLFAETIFYLQDISSGASMHFGTSFVDPAVPGDGFKFYSNPLGGAPTWVTSSSEYLSFNLTGAGTDTANTTVIAMPSYGGAGANLNIVGEYYSQPVLNKRIGTSFTATASTTSYPSVGGVTTGGVRITGSTPTIIHGIIPPDSTYFTTGRNGSQSVIRNDMTTASVTLKNKSTAATNPTYRMALPGDTDLILGPLTSATFSYNTGTSVHELLSTSSYQTLLNRSIGTFTGTSITPTSYPLQTWTYQGTSAQTFSTTGFGNISSLQPGTQITLVGSSATNTLTINNSDTTNGVLLPGTAVLGYGDSLVLEYSSYPTMQRMIKVGGSQ